MPTPANSINATSQGVVGFNGSSFTASTLTQYNTLVGGASSDLISGVSAAATGKLLQSSGAGSNPAFSTATYPSTATSANKLLRADGTNWSETTPTYPNAASTSGKVMVSDGTNFVTSTPTFPNASATSRKIIVSDGTNWVASTETYATPGTSGNVLTSDGTNWVSSAPATGGTIQTTQVTLTNAQLKAATSVQILAAQGSGTIIIPTGVLFKFVYGGSNAFTNTPGNQLNYGSTYGSNIIITNNGGLSFWQATTKRYHMALSGTIVYASSSAENTAVYSTMSTGATGNAGNNNTVVIQMFYYVLTI